jgi:hypothetical protein
MKWALAILLLAQVAGIAGCIEPARTPRAAYLLIEAPRLRSEQAQAVVSYLLGALQPGESFGIACLGTGNFSDRDTIASVSLDARPSVATQQKRLLKKRFDEFTFSPRPAGRLDLAGALLYAVAQLGETNADERYLLILADLGREQIPEPMRDFPLQMDGCRVIPIIVENQELTGRQQAAALKRLEAWEDWVEAGGGDWQLMNDLALLATIFPGS